MRHKNIYLFSFSLRSFRKMASESKDCKKACKEDQECNKKTNRCRTICERSQKSNRCLKQCPSGTVRNATSSRCRKEGKRTSIVPKLKVQIPSSKQSFRKASSVSSTRPISSSSPKASSMIPPSTPQRKAQESSNSQTSADFLTNDKKLQRIVSLRNIEDVQKRTQNFLSRPEEYFHDEDMKHIEEIDSFGKEIDADWKYLNKKLKDSETLNIPPQILQKYEDREIILKMAVAQVGRKLIAIDKYAEELLRDLRNARGSEEETVTATAKATTATATSSSKESMKSRKPVKKSTSTTVTSTPPTAVGSSVPVAVSPSNEETKKRDDASSSKKKKVKSKSKSNDYGFEMMTLRESINNKELRKEFFDEMNQLLKRVGELAKEMIAEGYADMKAFVLRDGFFVDQFLHAYDMLADKLEEVVDYLNDFDEDEEVVRVETKLFETAEKYKDLYIKLTEISQKGDIKKEDFERETNRKRNVVNENRISFK